MWLPDGQGGAGPSSGRRVKALTPAATSSMAQTSVTMADMRGAPVQPR
ncbi:hypothetical protein JOS77_02725 [Chromobacterium haemolyticum]|nr:hypothetical protein JOS77_02725 [Chromobacterium haemolyticum]